MQLRRGNQPKKSTNMPEYEIKTYGSNLGVNRSPKISNANRYGKQSSLRQEYVNDSYGELPYMEQGEGGMTTSHNQNIKQERNQNYNIRSPLKYSGNKENSNLNTNNNERMDMSSQVNFLKYNYNQQVPNLDTRRERIGRSPKTINIGESAQEAEYNIKSIKNINNKMRSPRIHERDKEKENLKDKEKEKENPIIEKTYNMISNEAGNIFLDQPIHQTSFINQSDMVDPRASLESKELDNNRDYPVREANYSLNGRDFGILGKMSPRANIEGDSESNSDKNESNIINNNTQIKDLRTQLEKRQNIQIRNDDGMVESTRPIQNEIDKIEQLAKIQESKIKDNITEEEVKKLVKLYVKSYDPKKDNEGRLISNKQTVVSSLPSIKEDLFNDRYKVLQKMNKLSNILLSKKNSQNVYEISTLNRSLGEGRSFDKNTLNKTTIGKKTTTKGKHNKFLFVSLAMLTAKANGKNVSNKETDKPIQRWQRWEKGGVVDLDQNNAKKTNKFKIKKMKGKNRGQNMINPKYKEKAAKIMQAWWRDQKAKYKNILNQIVKIQSFWRGKFTRKYVYDIIYLSYLHQRFFDIMERTLVKHTRPLVWDELFSRTKLAKSTMKKLLEKNDTKYTLLRIKPYFHKWHIISNFLRNRILKSKTLVIKKTNEEQKRIILKKYFDRWNLKANLAKYIGKTKKAEEKRQKFLGAYQMLNGMKSHTKKISMKQVGTPMKKYLQEILRKKLLKKIIKTKKTKNIRIKKFQILNQWKKYIQKSKQTEFKAKIFTKNIIHIDSRLDRIKLKYYLDKWRRHVPSGKRVLDIQQGADLLKKFSLKNAFIHPLNAFKEKINEKDEHNKMASLFVIKRRKIRDKLRTCLNKWKENTIKIDNKNERNNIYSTLLNNLLKNIEKRILYKRFTQWRQRPKVDINSEMNKVYNFTQLLTKIYKNNIRSDKYDFLDKLETTRAERAVVKSTKKIFKAYKTKSRRLLRHFFYKWRNQTKNSEITELQNQLLKYLFISRENHTNKLNLAKYMTRWRLFTSEKKHYDNIEKLKQVLKGGDILANLKNRRERDFLIRLYRKMGKDYRPIILDKLTQKLEKPRSTLRECLERWRRISEKEKALETITSMKAKFVHMGTKKINDRTKRDDLMKAFFRWKNMCRKPDEYYPKITRGFNILTKYSKKQLCQKPFELIYINRNFERPLQKIFKNIKNQEKRILNGKLRNLFGRWRKKIGDKNIKELKTNIIYKTKNNLENNLRIKTLAKYFTRWKLYRRKGLDMNFSKGINILTNLYRKPFYNNVLNAFSKKVEQISKLKGANNLFKSTHRYAKTLLRNAFTKMYKGAISIDPNRMKKIKTRLRRIIKHNEEEPRAKAFHRWANQVKLMQFRDKDMEKARVMIGNTLRNNDKMNLNYAMSRWKKKIQLIREQYLKSLLVKQIKSSQIVKAKMNNQAKLRAALLKWRAALAPVNYLDRIKQIKKGCKIFKRGLKKRDERQIFDGIYNLARKNRKNYLLEKIINVTNPNIDKYRMKECIDVWKSKLGDTQKMKNKMKTLLDDYLYSDKIHDGLITHPAKIILESMINFNKLKNEQAKKINQFTKGILLAKNNLNKLKLTLKLRKLFEQKNKDENYIKKMALRRYHRNVQKIKNNQNARIIQRFIKVKLRKYFDKRKLITKGANELSTYIKKQCLFNIKEKAKQNLMNKVLKNSIISQDKINQNTLLNTLNKWRNIIPKIKQNEAANKIQNLFRSYKSRQKLQNLEKLNENLKNIHQKYEIKNSQIKRSNLREWLNRAIMLKNKQNAKTIQRYIRTKMLFHKLKLAQNKLRNLFIKDTKHQLAKVMERSSRIIGGKGEVVYKAVQDILYKNPFNKFIDNLKFQAKINTLKKIQPKVHETLKKYYLPKILQKWKNNTYDQTVKCTKDIQQFLRLAYKKKLLRNKIKRENILKKLVQKKQKNNLYKLQLPFSIWHKKTILSQANENATLIQNKFRSYITQKHTQEILAKNKLQKIFRFNQLRHLLSKIKDAGNNKILNTNRKNTLTNLLQKKSYTDDKSALKRYFDKWRQYNTYTNNCVTKLANAFRVYKACKEKNRLQKINQILLKCVTKHSKIDNDQMRAKLRKWNNKTKLITYNMSTIKIQRFMRPKLAKIRNQRFKKYFYDTSKKKIMNLILTMAKFNKIKKSLERPSLQRFSNNLKKITLKNTQNEKLKNVFINKDDNTKELLLKKYLQKWYQKNDILTNKENESATTLQNMFRLYKAKKFAKNKLFINDILKKNILKKDKINGNKLYSSFKRWLNNVRNLTLNRNAVIIQMFCNNILQKIKKQKELSHKIRLNNFLNKIMTIKYGVKYAFNKLKNKSDEQKFIKFNNSLKEKRLQTLKNVFTNIKNRAFNNKLLSAVNIQDILRKRILQKTLQKWNEKSKKIGTKHSAEMLQKNWRIYLYKKKQENKKNILKHLLLKLSKKNSNIKYKYFTRMHNQALKKTELIQKIKLAKYIRERFRISEARKKWINLAKKYSLRNKKDDISNLVYKIKQYILLDRMKDPFVHKTRVSVIQMFKDKIKKNQIVVMLKKMLPERNDKNGHDTILKYLGRWKLNAEKLRERQNKFKNALETIEKRNLIDKIKLINASCLMKKLFSTIPKIRAKLFLEKLKKINIKKTKYEKLKSTLEKAKNDLYDQHKLQMLNNIYKIYAYHKLGKTFNVLNEHLTKKIKPTLAKEFLKKLYENQRQKAQYNYGNQLRSVNKAKITKINFNSKIKSNKPKDIIEDKNAPIKKCLPSFINYLENKIKNKKKDTLEKIKEQYKRIKFTQLLKNYSNKTILNPKKEAFNLIHRDALYSESRPLNQIKLFKLFRKKYIQELTSRLEEPARLYNLYYVVNVTAMHKKIAQQRFYRELIRKWRFAAFAKKMARKKLELMYKNLHASYLQMADEFFGEDSVNPSVIKEFEMFGNNVGMFTGENPQIGEEVNKKYYANVEKKYSFANGGEDVDKSKKIKKKKLAKSERIKSDNGENNNIIEEEPKKGYKTTRRDPLEKYKKK